MIDLNPVIDRLDECVDLACELQGQAADPSSKASHRRSAAELSRSLLQLADSVALASNLVRQEYWRVRGGP